MLRSALVSTLDELFNVATHGLGLAASIAIFPLLLLLGARHGDTGVQVGVVIFGVALIAVYAASTIYHALPTGPHKDLWRRLDQVAVYVLIAGTYTPFTLGALRGPWGWTLLTVIWVVAIVGIVMKVGLRLHKPVIENVMYLGMGWMVVIATAPLARTIGWGGLAWLLGGGIAYSVGIIFLIRQGRLRYGHCAWHVFVLVGSACHAIAVANYALRPPV